MYCKYFGFSERPFELSPDPSFLYLTSNHRETLASLIYGIQERRGIISITGEVGTGKTTLLNTLFVELDSKTKVAYIFNTGVNFDDLLKMILIEFELTREDINLNRAIAFQCLNIFAIDLLSSNGNVAIVIDEAQNLNKETLESLRLLSNLETPKHKLIQIVLSGQPELATKLSQPQLRQLDQRISLKRHIFAFTEEETYQYINHRLKIANYKGNRLFTHSSLKSIWLNSEGIPRKINILCDNALLIAFGLKKNKINLPIIDEVVSDLRWSIPVEDEKYQIPTLPQQTAAADVNNSSRTRLIFTFFTAVFILLGIACTIYFDGLKTFLADHFNLRELEFSELIKSPTSDHPEDTMDNGSLHTYNILPNNEQNPKIATQLPIKTDDTSKGSQPIMVDESSETVSSYDLNSQSAKNSARQKYMEIKDHVKSAANSKSSAVPNSNSMSHENAVAEGKLTENITTGPKETAEIDNFTRTFFQTVSQTNFPPLQLVEPISLDESTVVVEKNDTLHDIIVQHYGDFDIDTYKKVLDLNPFITNPDEIDVGQLILLPSR